MKVDAANFKSYDISGVDDRALTEDTDRAVGHVLGTMLLDASALLPSVLYYATKNFGRGTGVDLSSSYKRGSESFLP